MEFPWQVYLYGMATAVVLLLVWKGLWALLLSEWAVKASRTEAERAARRADAVAAAWAAWMRSPQSSATAQADEEAGGQ